jgi:hypothetical protein
MSNFLKYGDLIIFYYCSRHDLMDKVNQPAHADNKEGLLTALGFIDSGLYFQENPDAEGDSVDYLGDGNFPAFKEAAFKITPRLNSDCHKDYNALMEKLANVDAAIAATDQAKREEEKLEIVRKELLDKEEKLKVRYLKEQMLNRNIIEESLGNVVRYGAEIQLMHYDSQSFVTATSDASQTERIGYSCYLDSWYDPGMLFVLLPRFKSRQIGDTIQLRDQVVLKNLVSDAFISFDSSTAQLIYDDRHYGRVENPFLMQHQVVDKRTERYRAYLSQEPQNSFQLIIYRKFDDSGRTVDALRGGDIVRIMHTESESMLTSDLSYMGDGRSEVFLRRYNGPYHEENLSASSLWIIEHRSFDYAGADFPRKHNELETRLESMIRLRHFLTNQVIVASPGALPDQLELYLSENLEESDKALHLEFEPVVKNSDRLINDQIVFIKDTENGNFLRQVKERMVIRDVDFLKEKLSKNDRKNDFSPLSEADLDESRCRVNMDRTFSAEDAYKVSRVSSDERADCLFIRSALPLLKYLALLLQKTKTDLSRNLVTLVKQNMENLICFLFNKIHSPSMDFFDIEDEPLAKKQKLIRECGILSILVEIVCRAFKYNPQLMSNLEVNPDLKQVFRLAYTTMRYAIKEYRPNELYLSQWMTMVTEHSLTTQGSKDIFAGRTLIELIDNNKRILETRIQDSTLKLFIKFLQEKKDDHFVEILRVICMCDKEPMLKNQKDITLLVLKNELVRNNLLFELMTDPLDGVLFSLGSMKIERIPLKDLQHKAATEKGKEKVFNYVIAMTRLLADLCRDRNYLAIDELQQNFPFEVCFAIISENEYPNELRDAFVCLTISLWIDISPLQRIELPVKIKMWGDSKLAKGVKAPMPNQIVFGKIDPRPFIIKYLNEMKRENNLEVKFVAVASELEDVGNTIESRWSLDLAILTMAEKMLKLGIIFEENHTKQIVNSLKSYLKNDKNKRAKLNDNNSFMLNRASSSIAGGFTRKITERRELQQELMSKEILAPQLIVDCKKKICDIFTFVVLLSNEITIKEYLQGFKSIIQKVDPQIVYFLEELISPELSDQKLQNPESIQGTDPRQSPENPGSPETAIISSLPKPLLLEYRSKLDAQMNEVIQRLSDMPRPLNLDNDDVMDTILIELLLYKDPELKEAALNLINLLYTQRSEIGKIIYDLQIIEDEQALDHYNKAKEYCFSINSIGDSIEKWYKNSDSQEVVTLAGVLNKIYKSLLSIQRIGSMDPTEAYQLIQGRYKNKGGDAPQETRSPSPLIKLGATSSRQKPQNQRPNPRNVLMLPTEKGSPTSPENQHIRRAHISPTLLDLKNQINLTDIHQYHLDSEHEKIDPFEQDLFRNSGIYEGLLKILRFDSEIAHLERSNEGVLILRKIYRILAKSSKDSISNKHYLTRYLDSVVLAHLKESKNDFNAYFLLKEIVVDNKLVLLDEEKVKRISSLICNINERLPANEIRRSFNLCILKSMVRYKNLVLDSNQNYILDAIISKDYTGLQISFSNAEIERGLLKHAISENLAQYFSKLGNKDVVILPPDLCYIISYIDLLTSCAEDRNPFSENICQSILSMETIELLLAREEIEVVLKKPLVNFFYHVYLANDRPIQLHIIEVFLNILTSMAEEFRYYATKKYQEKESPVNKDFLMVLSNETYQSWPFIVEQYLTTLVNCFKNVIRRDLHLVSDSHPYRIYEEIQMSLFNYLEFGKVRLGSVSLERQFEELLRLIYNRNKTTAVGEHIREVRKYLKQQQPIEAEEGRPQPIKAVMVKPQRVSKLGKASYFQKIETLIDFYFSSQHYRDVCSEDFFGVIQAIQSIEKTTEVGIIQISVERVFSNLSRLVYRLTERGDIKEHRETLRTALLLTRRYLEMQQREAAVVPPLLFSEAHWTAHQAAIQARQDKLLELQFADLVCQVLRHTADPALCQDALLLAVALLWGGNARMQNQFLEVFEREDDHCTLLRLRQLALSSFAVVKKNMTELNADSLRRYQTKKAAEHVKKAENAGKKEVVAIPITTVDKDLSAEQLIREIRNEVEAIDANHSLCKCIFKFLQLLCEGHNLKVQNYLRAQSTAEKAPMNADCNFIALTASIWASFVKFVNPDCIDLGNFILDFLIESIQGPCGGNQLELYHNKMIEYIKDLMNDFISQRDYQCRGFDVENYEILDSLILRSIKSLDAMLEANPHREMYHRMGDHIEVTHIMKRLTKIFVSILGQVVVEDTLTVETANLELHSKIVPRRVFDSKMSEAFQIFFFLKMIDDRTGLYKQSINDLRGLDAFVYAFMDFHSAHIELVFNDLLQKHYFVVHPACRLLGEEAKQSFLDNADRKTPNRKITAFIQQAPLFFNLIDQLATLRWTCPLISVKLFWRVRKAAFLLLLSINIYVFLFADKRVVRSNYQEADDAPTVVYIRVHGVGHLLLSVLMLVVWSTLNCRLILTDGWRSVFNRARKLTLAQEETPLNKVERKEILYILEKNTMEITREDTLFVMSYTARQTGKTFQLPLLEYWSQNIMFLATHSTLRYLVFYMTASLLALATNLRLIYALLLFDLIVDSSDPGHVRDAAEHGDGHNAQQQALAADHLPGHLADVLLRAAGLFVHRRHVLLQPRAAGGENMCHTLVQCFTYVASLGPRSIGSVGDNLLRPSYGDNTEFRVRFYVRWLYEVSIFFIINVIFLKLILGIILDTFGGIDP